MPSVSDALHRILIADDHALIRKGMRTLMSTIAPDATVYEAANTEQVEAYLGVQPPDLLLLDYYLPGCEGITGIGRLCRNNPSVKIIVISSEERPNVIRDILAAGVRGFLPKSLAEGIMVKALEFVIAGSIYIPSHVLTDPGGVPETQEVDNVIYTFSPSQRRILACLIDGASNREIAERTQLALQTVKNQVSRILRDLRVENRSQAALKVSRLDQNAISLLRHSATQALDGPAASETARSGA